MKKLDDLVKELGGIPGYEQRPGKMYIHPDEYFIKFVKVVGDEKIKIPLSFVETELAIPEEFLRRYVEAKLAVVRLQAEISESEIKK
jgi:hypothetical protein